MRPHSAVEQLGGLPSKLPFFPPGQKEKKKTFQVGWGPHGASSRLPSTEATPLSGCYKSPGNGTCMYLHPSHPTATLPSFALHYRLGKEVFRTRVACIPEICKCKKSFLSCSFTATLKKKKFSVRAL